MQTLKDLIQSLAASSVTTRIAQQKTKLEEVNESIKSLDRLFESKKKIEEEEKDLEVA